MTSHVCVVESIVNYDTKERRGDSQLLIQGEERRPRLQSNHKQGSLIEAILHAMLRDTTRSSLPLHHRAREGARSAC